MKIVSCAYVELEGHLPLADQQFVAHCPDVVKMCATFTLGFLPPFSNHSIQDLLVHLCPIRPYQISFSVGTPRTLQIVREFTFILTADVILNPGRNSVWLFPRLISVPESLISDGTRHCYLVDE